MIGQTRLLLYTDDPGHGGVAVYSNAIACGLATAGYDVTLVQSRSDNPLINQQRQSGVRHCWLDFDSRKEFSRSMTDVEIPERVFSLTKPDFVLFANCAPDSHIAAKSVAIRQGLPFAIVEGFVAPYPNPTPDDAELIARAAEQYRHAKAVIAVSSDNLQILRRDYGLPPDKGTLIWYGRPDSYFEAPRCEVRQRIRQEFLIPSDAILCLTIGRLEIVKGYQHLVHALSALRKSAIWSKLHFAWIGPGSLESALRQALIQLGVADKVLILGQRWDVLNWLDASDVFLLPSYYEGMPLSIMEAMAKGLPVMASAVSGIPEQLGNTGKLLPSPLVDPQALATDIALTLETWASDDSLRRAIGVAGRARAQEVFREDRMVKQTAQVIERALLI